MAACLAAAPGMEARGQALPTATRAGNLQVGGGYSNASSDYVADRIRGFAFYSSFDFFEHIGVEVDFHQLNDPMQGSQFYERSYEAGGRYVRRYGRVHPYVKGMYGRGVLNFPQSYANLAYNMFVGGAGADIEVTHRINVRGDFEYQNWLSGPLLPHGLTPTVITVGAAYHFGGGGKVIGIAK